MKTFAVLEPFFHALSDGKLIRHTVAWVLRILAILMGLVGVLCFIAFVGIGFKATDSGLGERSTGILIGCILFALFGLAWGYLAAGVLFFRARSVAELGDSHFTVLSILSLLFRMNGEMTFVTYSLLGVGGCLFVWFTNFSPFSELGMLGERLPFAESVGSGFVGGIEFAVFMLLIAFAGIVLSYALAELTVVLVEIALNTRGLLTLPALIQPVPALTTATPSLLASILPTTPAPALQTRSLSQRVCSNCRQPLDGDSTFCDECGSPVG